MPSPQTDGMALETVSERPNFDAALNFGESAAHPATPSTPIPTTESAATSPAKPDPAPELTDEELAKDDPDPTVTTEAKPDADKAPPATATPTADQWDAIRKEFPDLTPDNLRQMRDRDKNTTADYTRKTQKIAEQRKALDEREQKMTERFGQLDSGFGAAALKIAKAIEHDPTLQARLEKAFQEVTVEPEDVNNVVAQRQRHEMDRRFKEQEERLASIEGERIQKQADERLRIAKELATKHDIDFDSFYAAMQREVNTRKANQEEYNIDELLEPVAVAVKAREEAKFKKYLEKWKQTKRSAAKVAPVGSRGGTVAPAAKEPDLDSPEARQQAMLRYLGKA